MFYFILNNTETYNFTHVLYINVNLMLTLMLLIIIIILMVVVKIIIIYDDGDDDKLKTSFLSPSQSETNKFYTSTKISFFPNYQ
jgi:hypothetical protein